MSDPLGPETEPNREKAWDAIDELRVTLHGDFVVDRKGRAADVEHARAERPTAIVRRERLRDPGRSFRELVLDQGPQHQSTHEINTVR